MAGLLLLRAGNTILNISTYFKEKSLQSFWVLMKAYLLAMTTWVVPYLISYLIWCSYLGYNWPIPFLGYNWMASGIGFFSGLWILLPYDVPSKKEFKRNTKLYILIYIVDMMMGFLKEGISILFITLPSNLQWIVVFLILLLKHFNKWSISKLVNRMSGGQSEKSSVVLGLGVNTRYSLFYCGATSWRRNSDCLLFHSCRPVGTIVDDIPNRSIVQ